MKLFYYGFVFSRLFVAVLFITTVAGIAIEGPTFGWVMTVIMFCLCTVMRNRLALYVAMVQGAREKKFIDDNKLLELMDYADKLCNKGERS